MIAVGILGVVSVGMASLFTTQQQEFKALAQKADTIELRNRVMNNLMRPAVCAWQLAGKVIDLSTTTTTVPSPTVIDFGVVPLYEGLDATSGILAQSGNTVMYTHGGIVVDKVLFKDILSTGIPNEYNGIIEIQFQSTSMIRPLRPIQIQQKITTNNATATATITTCGTVLAGNSSWVPIPLVGATQAATYISYISGGGQPSVICQNAGFLTFAGACRFIDAAARMHEGTVVANTVSGYWTLSCHYGGNSFYFSTTTMSEILCLR